jgi:hypothetical protein
MQNTGKPRNKNMKLEPAMIPGAFPASIFGFSTQAKAARRDTVASEYEPGEAEEAFSRHAGRASFPFADSNAEHEHGTQFALSNWDRRLAAPSIEPAPAADQLLLW